MEDSMPMMTFEIVGRVVPMVRMTQRSKWKDPQAKRYLAWKETFGWELKVIMLQQGWEMIPYPVPLHLDIGYSLPVKRTTHFDLSNLIKAIEDAAQHIVFENDNSVESITAWRSFDEPEYKTCFKVRYSHEKE